MKLKMEVTNKPLSKKYDVRIIIGVLLVFLFCVFLLYLLAKKPKEVIKKVPVKVMVTPAATPAPQQQPNQTQVQEIHNDGTSMQQQSSNPTPAVTPAPTPTQSPLCILGICL